MGVVLKRSGLVLLLWCSMAVASPTGEGRYLEASEFLSRAFPESKPAANILWVTAELRHAAVEALGYRIKPLRLRYWQGEGRTVWILDEIGKERPITIGVAVDKTDVSMVRILEFRESRGWEVRYPFFTDQFDAVRLDDRHDLDRRIDGITGATLSVEAVTRAVRLALFLHDFVGVGSD